MAGMIERSAEENLRREERGHERGKGKATGILKLGSVARREFSNFICEEEK